MSKHSQFSSVSEVLGKSRSWLSSLLDTRSGGEGGLLFSASSIFLRSFLHAPLLNVTSIYLPAELNVNKQSRVFINTGNYLPVKWKGIAAVAEDKNIFKDSPR